MRKNKRPLIEPDDIKLLRTLVDRLEQILTWNEPFGFMRDSEVKYTEMLITMFKRIMGRSLHKPKLQEDYEKNKKFFQETSKLLERFVAHPRLGKEYDKRRARGFIRNIESLEKIHTE